jgi:hypothetical protein
MQAALTRLRVGVSFYKIAESVVCARAIMTPDNCIA